MRCGFTPPVAIVFALLADSAAAQNQFGEYWPLDWGYSWEYSTTDPTPGAFCSCGPNPPPSCHWEVLGQTTFGGQTAWELGRDLQNLWYVTNDGSTFTFLGSEDCGSSSDPPDVALGAFIDASSFVFSADTTLVIRLWDQLDPTLTAGVYGFDPNECDVAVWVWYDTDPTSGFPPNAQNTILESNSTASFPPFAVTSVDFIKKGLGPIGYVDVDAANGTLGPWYDVVGSYDCNGNLSPDHLDISSGASLDANADGIPDECGLLQLYCTAKASSSGCVAAVSTSDPKELPVSGAADYSVTACNVHAQKNGLLFGSPLGSAALPFWAGTLCVQPPLKRGPILFSFGTAGTACDGSFTTTVNTGVLFQFGLDAGPGGTAWYQFWYRDPGNGSGSFGTALSNAIRLDFL